jgi:flagellar basal body-associated protein FliL
MAEKEPKTVKAEEARNDESGTEGGERNAKAKQIPLLVLIIGILVMLVTPLTSFFLVKMAMPKPDAGTEESAGGAEGKKESKKEGHGEGAKKEGKEGGKKEGHGESAKKEGGKKEGKGKENGAEQDSTTFTLPFMLINIAETKGTRILKITPHLILSEPEMGAKMPALKPLLMDAITTVTSGKTLDELDGPTGRENLKKSIIQRINKLLETRMTGAVADVYFEEFLIQ